MKIDNRQLTIGQFIKQLEACSPSYDPESNEETPKNVMFDFGYMTPDNIHSYRGYYEDIAIGYRHLDEMDKVMNVTDVIEMLKQAIGTEFHGYKDGNGYTKIGKSYSPKLRETTLHLRENHINKIISNYDFNIIND